MHCTIMLLAHIRLIYPLGHIYAESKLEVQVEKAQVEAITNLLWIKASPSALNQYSLSFILYLALCSIMVVH
jgi:hypothetical protein